MFEIEATYTFATEVWIPANEKSNVESNDAKTLTRTAILYLKSPRAPGFPGALGLLLVYFLTCLDPLEDLRYGLG